MEIENCRIMATLTVGEYRELMSEMGTAKPKEEEKEKISRTNPSGPSVWK